MNSGDYRVTAVLTEHLGFAPITLIDEVINAVNHIMYNCIDALEKFLGKRRQSTIEELKSKNVPDPENRAFPEEEIKTGAAELETLLVSHVDNNFDKFELYTLRNILTIPKDLVEDGWIKLKHHEGLDFKLQEHSEHSAVNDNQLKPLIDSIGYELQLRKILLLQKRRASKIIEVLSHYKSCVESVTQAGAGTRLPQETAAIWKQRLLPMNENVYHILGQADELLGDVLALNEKFMKTSEEGGIRGQRYRPTTRDCYIHDKSVRILDELGIVKSVDEHAKSAVLYSAQVHEVEQ